MTLTLTILLHS